MFNPTRRLIVDTKTQDRLRQMFSTQGQVLDFDCIEFGDSDVDYRLSFDSTKIRVLNAPYSLKKIKNKLAYEGLLSGVLGEITAYKRYLAGSLIPGVPVQSYYNYPTNQILSIGNTPPTLQNGFDSNYLEFTDQVDQPLLVREGWIVFLQTLPLGYTDSNGHPLRYPEPYEITINSLPIGYEFIHDEVNGSFLLSRAVPGNPVITGVAEINIKGVYSRLEKQINFDI